MQPDPGGGYGGKELKIAIECILKTLKVERDAQFSSLKYLLF